MKSLRYLNKYFLKYKWHFSLGIVFTIISNYFGIKMPLFVKDTIDTLMETTTFENESDIFLIVLKIGGIYMGLSIFSGFFLFLMRQTIIIMSRHIEFDLKNEIYAHYQKLDFLFYKRNATGDLMNRISEDVSQVRMYLGPGIMYRINLAVLTVMVVYQMIDLSGWLTFFVLLPLPVMSFLIYKVSSKMNKLSKEVQQQQSLLSTIAQETFAGIRVVKAYTREKEVSERFFEGSDKYRQRNMNLVRVNALFMPVIVFLIGVSTILSIYLGGRMTYTGEITPGTIVAILFYVNKLTWPFASLGWVTSINQRAAASQTRINEFLLQRPTVVSEHGNKINFEQTIEFRNVSLTYENSGITALKNFSCIINKGEQVAVLGSTGSGKSTILQLITRQIDPTEGEILIDGVNLKNIDLGVYRTKLGIVPQDVFLFSDTIGNNIRFGSNKEISEEEIIESCRKSHVLHNIEAFPEQFETLLGERGVNLSGGQKQRISIARALVRKPTLLLLDDCLSAVDTETEEIILRNLKADVSTTTSLIVSHRISSIRNANKIIVIDEGTCIEVGNHEDLLQQKGVYHQIYTKQLAEELEDQN